MPLYEKPVPIGSSRVRSSGVQTRIYVLIVAFVLTLLFIFIGIFTPLIVFKNEDSEYTDDLAKLDQRLANDAVVPFRQAISNASMITKAMQGYIQSRMKRLPDLNSPAIDRINSQRGCYDDFGIVVPTIASRIDFVAKVTIQPGGVFALVWPHDESLIGRDLFQPTDSANNFTPTPLETLHSGVVSFVGPLRLPANSMESEWTMVVRRPIYNRTDIHAPVDIQTFWGFAASTVNISSILANNPFNFSVYFNGRKPKVDYLLSSKPLKRGKRVVVASSLPNKSPATVEAFIREGASVMVMSNHDFLLTVRVCRLCGTRVSANNVTVIVTAVIAGLFLIFAVFAALTIFCCRPYDAAAHAPKLAPFAMLTVGPCRGEELWDLAPDEMVVVTDQLSELLARQMQRHHAYEIQQVHPLTTSYVTRTVSAAVQMAFDMIEELHRRPIDDALRHLLGDDGRLLLSYAVHWCNDAVVRLDPMEGGYRYEGPDVVYGGRMWVFAAPSVVTVSEAVEQVLPRFGLGYVTVESYRRVNVVRSRSVCGATGDCVINGGGSRSSSSGAATIYVPFPAPTTVQATIGMGSLDLGGVAAAHDIDKGDDREIHLPAQALMTLVDTRRPVLVAARDAAPTPRQHSLPLSASFSHVAEMGGSTPRHVRDIVASPITASMRDAESQNAVGNVHSGSFFHSSEEEAVEAASSSVPAPSLPNFGSSSSEVGISGANVMERGVFVIQGDGVTRALLRPVIAHALDVALHAAFDYQSITLDVSYDSVRVLVYYFYSSYKILFRPLAAPERHNIYRRLVTAFGVPQQGILEHLAARCAIRCLQHSAKLRQTATQRQRGNAGTTPVSGPLEENTLKHSGHEAVD
ncbi:hypothetical protein ABL78_4646 [Leptomonas seymouri]|uniref:CHASE domain-containing protein n=1 Tax=Leptomonas seymouri TaxID=5684 RepID=A0A0N0P5C6_LEPSE|nr:hypothetical protein ABL78_4646 [Leptomonas seymouri]|eukprot:KPI86299.1 hypothetical protein ABL78_4646 [Leptomonas seymouri]